MQGNFKYPRNPKIIKIQQVHQKLQAKQFLLFCLNGFLFVILLNLKRPLRSETDFT